MMKAVYNISTSLLIIMGENIRTLIKTNSNDEWDTVYDLDGKPLYDFQLSFDDSIDDTKHTTLNPSNYNLQYVNLIPDTRGSEGDLTQGEEWRNAEIAIIRTEPFLELLGVVSK